MPALLTSTSTGPWRSSTSLNARSTASASVTSHVTPNSPSGAPLPRWVTATESPASAKARAMASPMPLFPPVTSTDLPTCHSPAPTAVWLRTYRLAAGHTRPRSRVRRLTWGAVLQTAAAGRPGARPLHRQDLLGDGDLLGLRREIGPRGVGEATECGPGRG